MADILKHKTVTGTDGAFTVNAGVNLSQIIAVKRQGLNYDYTGLLNVNDNAFNWSFQAWNKRIRFNNAFPFVGNEVIYIMYKVTV